MESIYETFIRNLKYNETIVIAVSGGIDSMALLHLFARAKKVLELKIIVAHVNHNVREESKQELEFVKSHCLKNGFLFESLIIENYGDDNFHNEARTIRYDFFEKVIMKYNSKYLFTAHHADDLMETILMRIVRGSTLKGYGGFQRQIKMKNYNLIRPLIYVSKEEITKYVARKKIKYVQDISNFSDKYTRNRFRQNIIPGILKEDPNVYSKFNKFSELLFECNEYVEKQLQEIIREVYPANILNLSLFFKKDSFIRKKILYYIMEDKYQDDLMLITDKHVNLVFELINSNKTTGTVHLPNNIKVEKAYGNLYFKDDIEDIEYEIELDKYVTLPNGKIIEKIKQTKNDGNEICRLSSGDIKLPLYVRNKKNGDKMTIKGMLGKKKVSDIFINSKIKLSERNNFPVVCDAEDNIVWLPGVKKSKFCKENKEKCDIILRYY